MRPEKILIATPTVESTKTDFTRSLVTLDCAGYRAVLGMTEQTLVDHARNDLVRQAIESNCDHILWLDSDMVFEADTLQRLAKHAEDGLEYVTGIYFARAFPTVPVISQWLHCEEGRADNGAEIFTDYPQDSLFEIAASGFGCVLTKTSLFQEVTRQFKTLPFERVCGLGEDYSFCWRLSQLGKQMWCDSSIKCGHVGSYTFTENDYLKQKERIKENVLRNQTDI